MNKKIYLAGAMTGMPEYNFPAFHKAAAKLRAEEYYVFNPAETEEGLTYREYMKIDLNFILDRADAVALLPGWENSPGTKVEKALADCLKLEVIYL